MKRKRITISILAIFAIIVATFSVTYAYFKSNSVTKGGKFTAGTLNLKVGEDGTSSESFTIDNIGESDVKSGSKTWTITNTGTLQGQLFLKLENLNNFENGCNEPEGTVDTTCDNPGENQGELGRFITLKVYLNDTLVAESNLDETNTNAITNAWNAAAPVILNAGQSDVVRIDWSLNENDYGNEIQSDSLSFDVGFELAQVVNQ